MPITTHILDTSLGRPAAGISVSLARHEEGGWHDLGVAVTNADGRCSDLYREELISGLFRLHFAVCDYFERMSIEGLYPFIEVVFQVHAEQLHYHIPLLLTPHSYGTYRGS